MSKNNHKEKLPLKLQREHCSSRSCKLCV